MYKIQDKNVGKTVYVIHKFTLIFAINSIFSLKYLYILLTLVFSVNITNIFNLAIHQLIGS